MKLKFTSQFKFAHGGTQIEEFSPGQVVENPSPRLYQVAIEDGAAVDLDAPAEEQPETKPKQSKAKA